MNTSTFDDHLTIGVSAIVEVLEDAYGNGNGPPVGSIGMVVAQRPNSRYRYGVMIPGDSMPYYFPASKLRTLQGTDHRHWWMRTR